MEDQPILEDTSSEFITLSYADQTLASHPEQLPNECTNMILDPDNCQNINTMVPLNDLLLGQTFIIETNEQPLFVNGTQLITFQHIDENGQIDDIQAISTIDSEKSIIQNINFTIDSNNQFQDIYTNFNKTTNVDDNLKEHLEIINNTDIDPNRGNYSNSTAIKILDDVAISPTDTNGHFVCDICLFEFYKWQNYKKHKLEHLNDKPFKCLKCLKSFNYNNNYILHIASHLTNNLECPECKKEFKRIASFKSHLKIHKTEESITCNICNKIFNNQYRLDIHKEHCMQENILNPDNPTELTIDNIKTCKTCKMSISTISEYKMHIKEHRKFDSVLKKQYKCTMKLKKMHKTSNLVKRFKCDHCEWSFNKSNLLNRHMRTHTGEKPFKCSYCLRYFTQQNSLNRHMLKHKGLRPFKCEFCEMNFSQKGHLINHMKRCHAVTKESTRIHKCSMCSCVYNSLNALNKHLNTYHGLKTKILNKNIQQHVPKNIEIENINESINLIKDSSKLEEWLKEVANELQSSDNNAQSKHCNDPISTQCEFEFNLIENEQFNHIENNFSQISNVKTSDQTEIESLTYSTQNGENHTVSKTKEQSTEYDNVIKIKEKELITSTNINETIPLDTNKITYKQCSSRKKKSGDKISKSDTKTIPPKKTNERSLNLKNSSINQQSIRNKNQINNKTEPKVVYVPNITTNVDDNINVNIIQKPQPKVCQFCGKIFKKNADLERHERTHTGDKPYKCDKLDCNKAFATKCSLEYHTVTHLGKMKRAVCPQCSGLFATTSSMKVHMRQHTGEKPFKCPVCGDAFRTSGHLHTHVIIHERKKKRK